MLDLSKRRDAHVDARLRSEPMIWLSTVRHDGRPHLVPVWFLWDGEAVLIFSQPNQQKIRNIQQNNNVMLALDTAKGGGDIVMIEGKAELLENGNEKVGANMPEFAEKYAANFTRMNQTADAMAKTYSQAIRVTPTKFLGFGE
jgi:PPOX class probable F420-dependent enzyme